MRRNINVFKLQMTHDGKLIISAKPLVLVTYESRKRVIWYIRKKEEGTPFSTTIAGIWDGSDNDSATAICLETNSAHNSVGSAKHDLMTLRLAGLLDGH